MGVLSRYLLLRFLNIPFVRRHFHKFLSNEERLLWLGHRIQPGSIMKSFGLSNYPNFTGDREFFFISPFDVLPRVGDVVCVKEPNMANKNWAKKHPQGRNLTKRIAGLEGYCGDMKPCWRGALLGPGR